MYFTENDYSSDAIQFSSSFSEVYDIATGNLEIVQIFCIKGFAIEAGDNEESELIYRPLMFL